MHETARFSANQLKYIDWLATGKYSRTPPTEKAFAAEIGVNDSTLRRWKQGQNGFTKEQFWETVTARARDLNREHLATVYESLRTEAEKGSFQHQKLILELAGEYTETTRREISGEVNVKTYQTVGPDDWDDNEADSNI